jgi:hypothetical protein
MTEQRDRWPLDLELVGICGDDYESLEIIQGQLSESYPELTIREILSWVRDLQLRGWMICYRHVIGRAGPDPGPEASLDEKSKQWLQEFVPVLEFTDAEAAQLWWASTDTGIKALASYKKWIASRGTDDKA